MSRNTTWITPKWLIDAIGISDLDPCGYRLDGKIIVETARKYYTLQDGQNGLIDPWAGTIYCNPPYNNTAAWLKKCREYHQQTGEDVIMLIKNVIERIYFQDEFEHITGIVFIRGHVAFLNDLGEETNKAMFGSLLIAFGDGAFERINNVQGVSIRLKTIRPISNPNDTASIEHVVHNNGANDSDEVDKSTTT
jgi:phage N-6-adenine-methyltransferase